MNAGATQPVVAALWLLFGLALAAALAAWLAVRRLRQPRSAAPAAAVTTPAMPMPAPPRFYYLRASGGGPQGPVELTTLRAMVIDGRLDAMALVAVAGTDRWRHLDELLADAAVPHPAEIDGLDRPPSPPRSHR